MFYLLFMQSLHDSVISPVNAIWYAGNYSVGLLVTRAVRQVIRDSFHRRLYRAVPLPVRRSIATSVDSLIYEKFNFSSFCQ